jgi:hypothetical protein
MLSAKPRDKGDNSALLGDKSQGGESDDEMKPCAGARSLLNRPPLGCERPLEGPGFDGLAERQLFQESFPVAAGHG